MKTSYPCNRVILNNPLNKLVIHTIVIFCSLDSSLIQAKNQGTLQADKERYKLFENIDSVTLLTQDTQSFQKELDTISHVPLATTKNRIIHSILTQQKIIRWGSVFLSSTIWSLKNRSKIKLIITENINSPVPFLISSLSEIPLIVQYHYDVATQVSKVNKTFAEGIILFFLEKTFFGSADLVWVTANSLVKKAIDFGAKKVTILPNWYTFKTDTERLQSNGKPKVVTFVGRLHPVKRVHILIEAFSKLKKTFPNAKLNIIGNGPEYQKLQQLAEQLNIFSSINFLGFQEHKTVLEILKDSSIFVMSSKMEGNPKALIEAMMTKVPIVATKAPGIVDMVTHKKTGYLSYDDTPQSLADAMNYMLSNPKIAEEMAKNAYVFARNHFSEEQALRRIQADINNFLQSKRAQRHKTFKTEG